MFSGGIEKQHRAVMVEFDYFRSEKGFSNDFRRINSF